MDGTLKLPFEAVAIRYVHDVRAEEFLNIGIVLLSRAHAFAGARFLPQWGRVSAAFLGADLVLLRRVARAFQERCAEWAADVHRLLPLDRPTEVKALVHSVMLPDDASIQFSPVIGGITTDAERTLGELFQVYVGA